MRDDAEGLDDRAPVGDQRGTSGGRICCGLEALGRLADAPAQQPADDAEADAADEREHASPRLTTCSAPSAALTSHADPEPRMNPIVVPAAVELLTRPRISGRRLLGGVDHRPGELAAEREALDDAHGHEQHGRRHADLRVGRAAARAAASRRPSARSTASAARGGRCDRPPSPARGCRSAARQKPSANTAKASSCCAVGLDCGKNCLPMSLAK